MNKVNATNMKTLLLLRHAKSDWNGNSGSDHSRSISARGRDDATRLGVWVQDNNLVPQQIISSDAFRTQQTVECITESWQESADIQFTDILYLASEGAILELIQSVPESVMSIMLVAHNPGMDAIVEDLAQTAPPLTNDGKLMATCNMAVFNVACEWAGVRKRSLELVDIVRPASL